MKEVEPLEERLLSIAANTIRFTDRLTRSYAYNHIGTQLIRSITSSGANYQEACGAQSRADFVHKIHLVLKELRESVYWLKLLERLSQEENDVIKTLLDETVQLTRIMGKSIVTAKGLGGK
jgi:four helix bundle protein